jgi:hypothetical protein
MHIQDGGMHNDFVDYFLCVLVNMVFAMLLWVCIHTGQAEKLAWPRWESNSRNEG